MRYFFAILLAFSACGATCTRSEVRSERREEHVVLDAGVQIAEEQHTTVEQHTTSTTGVVDTVRVEEVYTPMPTPKLARRIVTTTRITPTVETSSTVSHTESKAETTARLNEVREVIKAVTSDVEVKKKVGLSWPIKLILCAALLVAAYLTWRHRASL